jgi:hypothetical protein
LILAILALKLFFNRPHEIDYTMCGGFSGLFDGIWLGWGGSSIML